MATYEEDRKYINEIFDYQILINKSIEMRLNRLEKMLEDVWESIEELENEQCQGNKSWLSDRWLTDTSGTNKEA